jgi:hypothetical protein
MKKRRLVAPVTVMATLSLLLGVSAFADNRPRERSETRIDRSERGNDRRSGRETARGERQPEREVQRNDAERRSTPNREAAPVQRNSPNREAAPVQRNSPNRQAAPVQRNSPNRQAAPVQRNNPNRQAAPAHRAAPNRQVAPTHRPSRQPHYAQGRVTRTVRHGSGYHVFVAGSRYPYFIPASYYHPSRFRVGLMINIGGFYNPLGYYDYYHAPVVAGRVRGYVEDVDYRRGTFVVRNEATGRWVTAVIRDRRMADLRRGDYVELSGDWRRNGVFDAYRIHLVDYGYGYGR